MGTNNKNVIVLQTPVTERYCNVGDVAVLDIKNSKIRCGGVWFDFDEQWDVQPSDDEIISSFTKNQRELFGMSQNNLSELNSLMGEIHTLIEKTYLHVEYSKLKDITKICETVFDDTDTILQLEEYEDY